MEIETFKEKSRVSAVITIVSSVAFLLEILLCVFQYVNGIISIWNIVPLFMVVAIMYIGFSGIKHDKRMVNTNIDVIHREAQDMDSNTIIKVNRVITTKHLLVSIGVMTLCLGATILFAWMGYDLINEHQNRVVATIVGQDYEVIKDVQHEYDEDENIEETTVKETRINTLFLEYEYNGKKFEEIVKVMGLSKVKTNKIEICLDSEGNFIRTFDSIKVFYFEAICFGIATVLILFSLIFMMPWEFLAFLAFAVVGMALLGFVNHAYLANTLYNDITAVIGMFFSIGVFGMIGSVLHRIFDK